MMPLRKKSRSRSRTPRKGAMTQKIRGSIFQHNMLSPKMTTLHWAFSCNTPAKTPVGYYKLAEDVQIKANNLLDIVSNSPEITYWQSLYESIILDKVAVRVTSNFEIGRNMLIAYDDSYNLTKPAVESVTRQMLALRNKRYHYCSANCGPQTYWFNLSNVGGQPKYLISDITKNKEVPSNVGNYGYLLFGISGDMTIDADKKATNEVAPSVNIPVADRSWCLYTVEYTLYVILGNPFQSVKAIKTAAAHDAARRPPEFPDLEEETRHMLKRARLN